jgi:hypothetical protein
MLDRWTNIHICFAKHLPSFRVASFDFTADVHLNFNKHRCNRQSPRGWRLYAQNVNVIFGMRGMRSIFKRHCHIFKEDRENYAITNSVQCSHHFRVPQFSRHLYSPPLTNQQQHISWT